MKYFTYELIAAANDWIDQTDKERRLAEKRAASVFKKYLSDLESLKPRISAAAWAFFRHGFGEKSLHDARLLSLRIGDGLDYVPDGVSPFLVNRKHTSAIISFLNYEQDQHYYLELRGVRRVRSDLLVDETMFAKSLGSLYTYELTASGAKGLQLGFLFASGGTVVIEFQRLVFRKWRIKREYEVGEMYR